MISGSRRSDANFGGAAPQPMPGEAVEVPVQPKFQVWGPNGVEMHTREVINDLCRHGTLVGGKRFYWSASDPAKSPALKLIAQNIEEDLPERPASPKLDALRQELSDLGGEVNPCWGLKSLQREVDALKAQRSADAHQASKTSASA